MESLLNINENVILSRIYIIRGQKILLDSDLAEMYGVETKQLKRQVRRNIGRFPEDFMFELTKEELENLRSQSGTSSWGGIRYVPMAFREQGVAMMSSVLNSERAIGVNILIIRIFTKLRTMLSTHKDILIKLEQIEKKLLQQDNKVNKQEENIEMIFNTLKEVIKQPNESREPIGFKTGNKN